MQTFKTVADCQDCFNLEDRKVSYIVKKGYDGVSRMSYDVQKKVSDGIIKVSEGARKLSDVVGKVSDGVRMFSDGVRTFLDGVSKV